MRRRTRFGILAAITVTLFMMTAAVYALLDLNNSVDGSRLPGFPLVRPAFAQTEPLFIFEEEAGLSAYTQIQDVTWTLDDLISLSETLFQPGMRDAGDNYVMGEVAVETLGTSEEPDSTQPAIEVFLYVDTDGWLLAYASEGRQASYSLILNKACNIPTPEGLNFPTVVGSGITALECVLGAAATVLEAPTPVSEDINWYHWEFDDATQLVMAQLGISAGINKNMFVAVPADAEWRDTSLRTIWINRTGGEISGIASFDGQAIVEVVETTSPSGIVTDFHFDAHPFPDPPEQGELHTINLQTEGQIFFTLSMTVGVAFVYKQ